MPYEFLEDGVTADVTFRVWGQSLEELLLSAAEATTSTMVDDPDSIEPREERTIRVEGESEDFLLVRFLEEMIFYKDAEVLLLRATDVQLSRSDGKLQATAVLRGEEIDPRRHDLVADPKAVTWHRLHVVREGDLWQTEVTLDV